MEIRSVQFYRAAYEPADFPTDQRPQFAIAGRSNVGKSSLINAVLKRKAIARVSHTPGKTQAIHFYLVNDRFHLVDLPGYGYAKVSKSVQQRWHHLINAYLEESEALRALFLLIDARRTPGDQDKQMHAWMTAAGVEERIAMTKIDKLSRNEIETRKVAIAQELGVDESAIIPCSAVTKKGIEDLRREIASRL